MNEFIQTQLLSFHNGFIFNQEKLYKQLRSIPVTSIGIVKCVVATEGAEHLPGEQEIRVKPEAIQSTVLVTKGSG